MFSYPDCIGFLISDKDDCEKSMTHTVNMENIGQRIKRLRTERGLRQKDLVASVDAVKQSTLSAIESLNLDFGAVALMQFSRALMVSPEYIVYGGEEEDMGTVEIVQLFKALPAQEREMLLKTARALLPNTSHIKAA
jgi:transcriptional regulator with XRE-family HTH domain